MEKGKLITFEGMDGAGKSVQIEAVNHFLQAHHISTITTREPGSTLLGEQVRQWVLNQNDQFLPQTHALLMYAARVELLHKVIIPALQKGCWVLSDRFADATFAYQGGGEHLGLEKIAILNQWALDDFAPDLTFFFHVDFHLAQQRIQQNRAQQDHFEKENQDFFERVEQAYLSLAKQNPARIRLIDATQSQESVRQNVVAVLQQFLEKENAK